MAVLKISDVTKIFPGGTLAVDTFSLEVADGELVCLLGPSGSGKSTLLRMVGGFETMSSGVIAIDGEDVTRLPPEKRPTGMVFQSHALWTHMDVFKNIAFGLKLRRLPADEVRQRVEAVLELVGLTGYGSRRVTQLSGGQQQRVGIARAVAMGPKVLLLDEVTSALDPELVGEVLDVVKQLAAEGMTMLMVTHEIAFARDASHRIVFMAEGSVSAEGKPADLMASAEHNERLRSFLSRFKAH